MKIGILSRKQGLCSTQSLTRTGIVRSHAMRTPKPLRRGIDNTPNNPAIHCMGQKYRSRGVQ
jgi:hypothetical protein